MEPVDLTSSRSPLAVFPIPAPGARPEVPGEPALPTVLHVDDNEAFREIVAAWLAGDYRVEQAADGPSGLAAARRVMPDVIIIDLMMPAVSGIELLRLLREDAGLCRVPVIVATVYPVGVDRATTEALAGTYVLRKPFDRAALIEGLDAALAGPVDEGGAEPGSRLD